MKRVTIPKSTARQNRFRIKADFQGRQVDPLELNISLSKLTKNGALQVNGKSCDNQSQNKCIMKYNVGDIVLLKDDGETQYKIASTKQSGEESRPILEHGFDYFVTRVKTKNTDGVYSRQVFEENIYIKQAL